MSKHSKFKLNYKKVFSLAAAVLALILIAIAAVNSANAYKRPFKHLEKVVNGDFSAFEKLMPEEALELKATQANMSVEEMIQTFQKNYDENIESSPLAGVKVHYKHIKKEGKVDTSTFDSIKKGLKNNYEIEEKAVKKALNVSYTVITEKDGEKNEKELTGIVVKIEGNWYCCDKEGMLLTSAGIE